jgi:DNA modification methylase
MVARGVGRGKPEEGFQRDNVVRLHKKTIYEALGRESVHPFPARMAPGIALEVISKAKKPLCVLDPMMGSGTVVALARLKKHRAVGVDIDPLAVLISKVWTNAVAAEEVKAKAREVLARAKRTFSGMRQREAYPLRSDRETRRFVAYWFDGYARKQLASLSVAIRRVRNESTRNVLLCALSRLIITKTSGASLAMDLSHSRPHKKFRSAPVKPFRKFLEAVDHVAENCVKKRGVDRGPAARVHLGDARDLPVRDASIDLVVTSPPYLNAIDYIRCSKFSLVWMGYRIPDLRELRAESIGAEAARSDSKDKPAIKKILASLKLKPGLSKRDEAVLTRYIGDMRRALGEVTRVLAPGGKAVYVVGENTIRGTYIRNSRIVCEIAKLCGLRLQERRVRNLPANRRYLPPPSSRKSNSMNTRMRREVVLAFAKPKPRTNAAS